MAFSGALTLTDLNDFITPSQACIKPVEETNKPTETEIRNAGAAATEIHIDESGSYYEVSQAGVTDNTTKGRRLEQAQISLNDCLACSGCITSAESVLITLQSHTEVLSVLSNDSDQRIPVISIAPQSLASLAAAYSTRTEARTPMRSSESEAHDVNGSGHTDGMLTSREVFHRIREFCTSILGFAYVFDTNFARHLALKEHVNEFLERRDQAQKQQQIPNDESGTPPTDVLPLPMLASACPGWICYAEKAHSEMLPFISRTKSPQQVMGTLVKQWIGKKLDKRPDEIYHVSVMPCYDKKLEASRQDFYNDVFKTRDVDCVVTTGELELMMKEFGWDLALGSVPQKQADIPIALPLPIKQNLSTRILPEIDIPELVNHPGTSSGSYLHAIIHHLMATSLVPLTLSVKAVRNADYEEYILRESPDSTVTEAITSSSPKLTIGKVVFKGVKCYGFRNLQNIVRKVGRERGVRVGTGAAGRLSGTGTGTGVGRGVRRIRATKKGQGTDDNSVVAADEGEIKFDYVEVMACPGGCVNGGGQLKPPVQSTTVPGNIDAEGYQRDWDGEGVAPSVGAKWGDKEWTKKVEEAYWRDTEHVDESYRKLAANRLAEKILEELCAGGNNERKGLLRTEYRAVESDIIGLAVKW